MSNGEQPGQVTTFYSYKGGVGRTFMLANVAWLLARWGRKVLCLDWDLEAPGLHRYLAPDALPRPGVLDLVLGPNVDWRELPTKLPVRGDGELHLISAGREDDDYLERLQRLDWERLYAGGLGRRLETLRAEWVEAYDHVLIDSRTGVTDIGGICAAQLPDVLVFLFTANFQSLHGAQRVVRRALKSRARLAIDRGAPKTLPVPSRFDAREEYRRGQQWLSRFARELREFYSGWLPEENSPAEVLGQLRIPYLTYWSFGENLPVAEERLDDPELISYWFANVAAFIERRLHAAGELIGARREYLQAVAGDSLTGSTFEFDIFLSYSSGEREIALRLADELMELSLRVWVPDYHLIPGEEWASVLEGAIRSSRSFVVLVGDTSSAKLQQIETSMILDESEMSRERRLVIPVRVGDAQIPDVLQSRTFVQLDSLDSAAEVASRIKAAVTSSSR